MQERRGWILEVMEERGQAYFIKQELSLKGEQSGWRQSSFWWRSIERAQAGGGSKVIYCDYVANTHFLFFLTNRTPILFGAAMCPAEKPRFPASFAAGGGHVTQLWPWGNQSGFLVKFIKGSYLKSHVPILFCSLSSSFLPGIWLWWLELQQKFCDHEVTLRLKASAKNGKTEREISQDTDDLVEPLLWPCTAYLWTYFAWQERHPFV